MQSTGPYTMPNWGGEGHWGSKGIPMTRQRLSKAAEIDYTLGETRKYAEVSRRN